MCRTLLSLVVAACAGCRRAGPRRRRRSACRAAGWERAGSCRSQDAASGEARVVLYTVSRPLGRAVGGGGQVSLVFKRTRDSAAGRRVRAARRSSTHRCASGSSRSWKQADVLLLERNGRGPANAAPLAVLTAAAEWSSAAVCMRWHTLMHHSAQAGSSTESNRPPHPGSSEQCDYGYNPQLVRSELKSPDALDCNRTCRRPGIG